MEEIGWEFRDRTLRAAASAGAGVEFERLELLGDAVADAVLLPWLYTWTTGSVAVLAGARQQLASDRALDHLAVLLGLHRRLPAPYRTSADHRADMAESVIGAAFIDGGWPAATAVCEHLFGAWLTEPAGVAPQAARVDVEVTADPDGDDRWRCRVWLNGVDRPLARGGGASNPVAGELAAIAAGLDAAGRDVPTVWIELSDDLRAEMAAGVDSEHAGEIQALRARLAAYDGVWFVPADRLDTTLDPWLDGGAGDGVITPFEARLGHDLIRDALERLTLHPGDEQRRLAFVGIGVLKSAASIRAFAERSRSRVSELHDAVHRDLAQVRLHRAAFSAGLVDLLFPGTRPSDPVALVRAALGATAVDAGPDVAVELATEWLEGIRVDGAGLDEVSSIESAIVSGHDGARHVDVWLATPDSEAHWRLEDPTVNPHVLALEGLCAALDSLPPEHRARPLLLGAPPRVQRAIDAAGERDPMLARLVARFLARVHEHGLRVLWHGQTHGSRRVP